MTAQTHPLRQVLCLAAALSGLALTGCGEPAPAQPAPAPAATSAANPADASAPEPAPAKPTAENPPPPPPPPPVQQTVDEDQMKTVRKWLDDSMSADAKVAAEAIERLKKMGNLAALPLAEVVAKDTDNPARQVAAMDQMESLKFFSSPRAIEVVVASLDGQNQDLKQRAIGVCGRQKLKQAMPALRKIMGDPAQSALKINAAQALIELGDEDALALAKALLTSDSATTRSRAVYMIRKQGDSKNLVLLDPLTKDQDRDVRVEVVEACGDLGGTEGVKLLGKLLDDDDHVILRDSCKHLKRITGVNIGREPDKWKTWLKDEFEKKGEAAFQKKGAAQAATDGPKPEVKRKVQMDRTKPKADEDGLAPDGADQDGDGN